MSIFFFSNQSKMSYVTDFSYKSAYNKYKYILGMKKRLNATYIEYKSHWKMLKGLIHIRKQ